MYSLEGTIAALSTPEGVGGIAVVRLSGPESCSIIRPCLARKDLEPSRAHFMPFLHPKSGELIDETVITYFKAPHSYTGEDLIEISCHGGRIVPGLILNCLYIAGARPALPGEFTRRAFINGKMDLTQAEAVADMIHAQTEAGLQSARTLLRGRLSKELMHIRQLLTESAALLEVGLDFSDQDIETISHKDVEKRVLAGLKQISSLISSYKTGRILHEGARVPIVGRPNAGKSSLLNAVLHEERVITSDIPGTTRDYIEERINHGGVLIRLFDTAGLRETEDILETAGLKKTHELMSSADLLLMVTVNKEETEHALYLLKQQDKPSIIALNKTDLLLQHEIRSCRSLSTPEIPIIPICAIHESNIGELMETVLKTLQKTYALNTESLAISHLRHQNHLLSARNALLTAQKALNNNLSPEFIIHDIREAISSLDDITGKTTSMDILNHIFDQFCVGK
jgi:tRNA modification GTPase